MTCLHSRPAWKSTLPNESGKHPISFKDKKTTPDYYIPCGKCLGCAVSRRLDWGVRMYHEAQVNERNCFVTLTYENPPDKINKHDPQTFIKRLRHHSRKPIRYFLCGEYGEKTRRPHYHAVLFGEDFLGGAYDINGELYGNPGLDAIWKHGHCSVAEFSLGTAMYTAGYVSKKLQDHDTFNIMSRKPPLGREWFNRYKDNLYRIGHVNINGQEFPVPKVYLNWLEGGEGYETLLEKRQQHLKIYTDRALRSKGANYQAKANLKAEKI